MATETQETTMITERDVVERERAAFMAGASAVFEHFRLSAESVRSEMWPGSEPLASKCYPLPKVTRPRKETDQYGDEWKYEPPGDGVVDGTFYRRTAHSPNGGWTRTEKVETQVIPTLARLLAQPTEEVTA